MLVAIADTHAVLWYLYADPRLSAPAKTLLEEAASHGNHVGVSTITLAEIVYLSEKGRIHPETPTRVLAALDAQDTVLVDVPFDRAIARALPRSERTAVPDLPDRVIAATALHLNVPLISRDRKIRLSVVETIW